MKMTTKPGLFPWFSLLTGVIGFALRCVLLSSVDGKGLLPKHHFAGIVCFVLLAITLGVCFWRVRQAEPSKAYRQLFPVSRIAALGSALGALGMGCAAFTLNSSGLFRFVLPLLGCFAAGGLVYAAYCRYAGLRPNSLFYGPAVVYLILRTLLCCRMWGSEPQLQLYFFSLLGYLFLLIACYYRAEASALIGDYRRYLFFSQGAVFCLCLCLLGKDWLFCLSAVLWLSAETCRFPTPAEDE